MQHHARPARAKHDVHFTGRSGDRIEIDQRLPHGFVDGALPGVGHDELLKALAAAEAVTAGFLTVAIAYDNRYVQPHERTDIAIDLAIGAQNLNHLPRCPNARRYLTHARILAACISVDRLEQLHFCVEGRRAERVVVGIKFAISAARCLGIGAVMSAFDCANRLDCARNRTFRQVGGMRIAHRLIFHRTQTKTLRGVVRRLLETAVVERERLGLAVFEEQFAIVGALEAAADQLAHLGAVEARSVDQ